MILSIKMHPACGQDHSSRVHFLLRRQAGIKSPTSRDFFAKVVRGANHCGQFLFFCGAHFLQKVNKIPLQKTRQIFLICQSFARNAFFAGQCRPAVLKQC